MIRNDFKLKKIINSWSRSSYVYSKLINPKNLIELRQIILNKKNFLAVGNYRSYGNVCLNKNLMISMKNFKKIIGINYKKKIIEAESGMLLSEILQVIVPKGYFIPVSPGTKFVTLGGMIANNVHGKNVNKNYSLNHFLSFKILKTDGRVIECSKKKK